MPEHSIETRRLASLRCLEAPKCGVRVSGSNVYHNIHDRPLRTKVRYLSKLKSTIDNRYMLSPVFKVRGLLVLRQGISCHECWTSLVYKGFGLGRVAHRLRCQVYCRLRSAIVPNLPLQSIRTITDAQTAQKAKFYLPIASIVVPFFG